MKPEAGHRPDPVNISARLLPATLHPLSGSAAVDTTLALRAFIFRKWDQNAMSGNLNGGKGLRKKIFGGYLAM